MDQIPAVLYQSAAIDLEFELNGDATLGVFVAMNGNTKYSVTLSEDNAKWKGTLSIPANAPLGDYTYQVWSDDKLERSGAFTVAAGFRDDGVTALPKSPNEQRLDAVNKSIAKMQDTGTKAYGISGSFTTRISLQDLHKERYRLSALVNKERKAKGLPPLEGSENPHTSYTYLPR